MFSSKTPLFSDIGQRRPAAGRRGHERCLRFFPLRREKQVRTGGGRLGRRLLGGIKTLPPRPLLPFSSFSLDFF